ncbi:hypothetical protein [Pseudonocardia xinjiangensis]|uniref:Excreted virulence factor EspC (Type VII ESX diderm) n=1 Tax=Pseudonocardia xinjiangensis TaxID=75289 RepID=A0ABX1RP60_9PSEU|nr:hypothetical protein [Pseudonocardia xinjiangensis]NMH81606.1 hypothetical protein [Pseudonocardia xinjiangensis]
MADLTGTATRATGGALRAGRELPDRAVSGVARKAMSEAGNAMLGAVVDMAIGRVDRVADRLDGVAESGGTGLREALTGRPTRSRSDRAGPGVLARSGTAVRARTGAAFSLVVAQAVAVLRFLQRLAQQVLAALQRLARRRRTAPAEVPPASADGPESERPARDREPGERRQRHGHRPQQRERPAPAGPAVRRTRPAAAPAGGGGRPRRPRPTGQGS